MMKNLIISLGLGLSLCLTLAIQANASDLEQFYPQQLQQAKNLYNLSWPYFKGVGSLPPGQSLTAKMVKDPKRLAAFYQIRRLLGVAVDAGYDLGDMAEFGLLKHEQVYVVDLKTQPQWAPTRMLFLHLRTPADVEFMTTDLIERGFDQRDITRLSQYLSRNHPEIRILKAEKAILATEYQREPRVCRNPEIAAPIQTEVTPQTLTVFEQVRRSDYDQWNQWGAALLDLFTPTKQTALLAYLQQNLGTWQIGSAPISKAKLLRYQNALAHKDRQYSIDFQIEQITAIINPQPVQEQHQ